MTHYWVWVLAGAAAYLLGAVPFGFLMAKACGKDIRTLGSGNIGATNVFRAVSKPLGILTFVLDFLKGFCGVKVVPVVVALLLGSDGGGIGVALFCGVMTVVGHNWTCFLKFKGGKGIATSAGMLMGLSPAGVGMAIAVWVVLFLLSRYVSVASMGAAATLALAVWWPLKLHLAHGVWFAAILTLLAAVAIWKHRTNIARLMAGTESRFSFGRGKG